MSWMIAKLADDEYVLWSTVVDAPISYSMTAAELKPYYVAERVKLAEEQALKEIGPAIERADAQGTSSKLGHTIDDLLATNRAGDHETRLRTLAELRGACRRPT